LGRRPESWFKVAANSVDTDGMWRIRRNSGKKLMKPDRGVRVRTHSIAAAARDFAGPTNEQRDQPTSTITYRDLERDTYTSERSEQLRDSALREERKSLVEDATSAY
jgi:hypothetical protein